MVFSYILNKLGLYKYNESKSEIDIIRSNLKHTVMLKRQFYIPNKIDLLNKMYMIKYKNNPKIDCDELLKAKQNLKSKKKKQLPRLFAP